MPDFWGNETEYDKNQAERNAARMGSYNTDKANKEAEMGQRLGAAAQSTGGSFEIYGDDETKNNQIANMSQVAAQTGQNFFEAGKQNQDYLTSLQARRNGTDMVGQDMKNQANRNQANMARQFAGKKVAGGVAGAAMVGAQNMSDSSTEATMQKNARTNDNDLFNYVKRQQKLNGEALANGEDKGLANQISVDTGSGIFGTVICTELNRQGILDDATYELDKAYGQDLMARDPYAFIGYCNMASPIVPMMAKSPLLTKSIAFLALPWAKQLSGKSSIRGSLVTTLGLPVCRLVGKIIVKQSARVNHA